MKFDSEIRKPSAFHEKDIDVLDKCEKNFQWECVDCESLISVGLNERLKFSFGDFKEKQFNDSEITDIKQFYAIGQNSRSPCGGGLYFEKIPCPNCDTLYLFSYGVNETSNSFLILTVQGVIKIERAQSGRREILTPAPHTTGHTDLP